jgi:hypothetical protein
MELLLVQQDELHLTTLHASSDTNLVKLARDHTSIVCRPIRETQQVNI